MNDVNPYESPSLSHPEPPLPTKIRPPFWTFVFKSGKYWAVLLGTALVGFCMILWCANVIVPYMTKVLTGQGRANEIELSNAISGTVYMLGFGIPICFIAGAIIGTIKHFLGLPSDQKSKNDDEIEHF